GDGDAAAGEGQDEDVVAPRQPPGQLAAEELAGLIAIPEAHREPCVHRPCPGSGGAWKPLGLFTLPQELLERARKRHRRRPILPSPQQERRYADRLRQLLAAPADAETTAAEVGGVHGGVGMQRSCSGRGAACRGTASAVQGTASADRGTTSAVRGTTSAVRGTTSAVRSTASAVQGTTSAVRGTASAVQGTASA